MLDAPVALIFFNRPELLRTVWQRIETIQPKQLILISDGPKTTADEELVAICRSIVVPAWDCEVMKIYRDENIGCRRNVTSGLAEVFSRFAEAIVLEDDCVPHPRFFTYCQELLMRYATDNRVFAISGTNQFAGTYQWQGDADYSFSRYFQTWGWAGWKRTWDLCNWSQDVNWNEIESAVSDKVVRPDTADFWKKVLDPRRRHRLSDIWGYQACLTGLVHDQYTIIPRTNLVSNIGLKSGVHFKNKIVNWNMAKVEDIGEVIRHNPDSELDDVHDELFERRHFEPNTLLRVIRRLFPNVAAGRI